MNILFTTYSGLGVGGAEVSMELLAKGLRKKGHKVIIFRFIKKPRKQ